MTSNHVKHWSGGTTAPPSDATTDQDMDKQVVPLNSASIVIHSDCIDVNTSAKVTSTTSEMANTHERTFMRVHSHSLTMLINHVFQHAQPEFGHHGKSKEHTRYCR